MEVGMGIKGHAVSLWIQKSLEDALVGQPNTPTALHVAESIAAEKLSQLLLAEHIKVSAEPAKAEDGSIINDKLIFKLHPLSAYGEELVKELERRQDLPACPPGDCVFHEGVCKWCQKKAPTGR